MSRPKPMRLADAIRWVEEHECGIEWIPSTRLWEAMICHEDKYRCCQKRRLEAAVSAAARWLRRREKGAP